MPARTQLCSSRLTSSGHVQKALPCYFCFLTSRKKPLGEFWGPLEAAVSRTVTDLSADLTAHLSTWEETVVQWQCTEGCPYPQGVGSRPHPSQIRNSKAHIISYWSQGQQHCIGLCRPQNGPQKFLEASSSQTGSCFQKSEVASAGQSENHEGQ